MNRVLKENELLQNYQQLIKIAEREFSPERFTQVKTLFDHFEERIIFAPASYVLHYHNCFIGGYCEHVLNVINASLYVDELWERMGGKREYTREELIFAAMFHDLGKLGNEDMPFYIPETSDWHRKNMNRLYTINEDLPEMDSSDRSLYLLAKFGISITQNEWYGIRLADGLYNEVNKKYFVIMGKDQSIKTNIHLTLHHADCMSAAIEKQRYTGTATKFTTVPPIDNTDHTFAAASETALENPTNLDIDFDDLFAGK